MERSQMSEFEKAAEEFAIEQSELRDKNGPTGNYDNRTWPNEQLDQFMMRHGFIAGARWQEEKAKGLVEALEYYARVEKHDNGHGVYKSEQHYNGFVHLGGDKARLALKAYSNEKGEE